MGWSAWDPRQKLLKQTLCEATWQCFWFLLGRLELCCTEVHKIKIGTLLKFSHLIRPSEAFAPALIIGRSLAFPPFGTSATVWIISWFLWSHLSRVHRIRPRPTLAHQRWHLWRTALYQILKDSHQWLDNALLLRWLWHSRWTISTMSVFGDSGDDIHPWRVMIICCHRIIIRHITICGHRKQLLHLPIPISPPLELAPDWCPPHAAAVFLMCRRHSALVSPAVKDSVLQGRDSSWIDGRISRL